MEEHFTIYDDFGPCRSDLRRDIACRRVRPLDSIDIPDNLAQRTNCDSVGILSTVAKLQVNSNACRSLAGVEIRDREVLLESRASIALCKEPVIRQGLHSKYI